MKVGFARVDMTPPLGTHLCGYFHARPADGIISPLYINTVAFDDGEKKAALVVLDLEGMSRDNNEVLRKKIAEKNGIDEESIFVCCTHTHLGPVNGNYSNPDKCSPYDLMLISKICDSVTLAIQDLTEAKGYVAKGKAEKLSFVRLFYMPDGTTKTNPRRGTLVDRPFGEPDEDIQLFKITREGKADVAIVNFQTHPDVIGGDKSCEKKICFEYPGFFRESLERALYDEADGKGVHAVFVNGCQGDTVHADRFDEETHLIKPYRVGVEQAKHMGRKLAGCVLKMYTYAEEVDTSKVFFKQKPILVPTAKGTPEQVAMARKVAKLHEEGGYAAVSEATKAGEVDFDISVASKFLRLEQWPDEKELFVSSIGVGDVVFVGFPGEPFTEIGRQTKANSPFKLTVTACMANGGEGYVPMKEVYYGAGYEATTTRFGVGTAEKLIDAAIELTNELHSAE